MCDRVRYLLESSYSDRYVGCLCVRADLRTGSIKSGGTESVDVGRDGLDGDGVGVVTGSSRVGVTPPRGGSLLFRRCTRLRL